MHTDPVAVKQIERELREWSGGKAPSPTAIDNLISVLGCLTEPRIEVDPEDGAIYARWTCSQKRKFFTLCFIGSLIVNDLSEVKPSN